VVIRVEGSARALLTGERTALNFLQRLSGIATRTAQVVRSVRDAGGAATIFAQDAAAAARLADLLARPAPAAAIGAGVLVYFSAEALTGFSAALTPFLGGSELDGGRFFGLPNVFIGLLLGAGLYAAARLRAWAGFVVLLGAALLAGLPFAGANLGGAVTLFAAAGLWLPLRARGRLRVPELAFAGLVVVLGTGLVLVAHRVSSLPTHVTTFEETTGAGGAWSTFVDRLTVGWHLIEHNPFALAPVAGVLATLWLVVRPPASIAPSLGRHPAWRDALLVLSLGNVVAYVVNDSGPAACGVGFGMALGGLLYVSVAERTWKMAPA
jgi:hypothetical protein